MSFKENSSSQISFTDNTFNLTPREIKALEKSWAKIFADEIFPNIDEKRFSVLYSSKNSRPNTPVNVIVGALIIKELFDYSDDELVENIMLDLHLRYALHTINFEEQPLSDKTLSRFRKRCYDYEQLNGVDLFHECVNGLNEKIAKLMGINGRIRRMDSMMINSNIRKLSRMELIYVCISDLVKYISNSGTISVPEGMEHYTDSNDFNKVIYHQRNEETDTRIDEMLSDAEKLIGLCSELDSVKEYELFVRCMSEQTVLENGRRRLKSKDDGKMDSSIMQNPSDPEATYREKSGKGYSGYVANVEEAVSANGSVVIDYQYESNSYSDSQFLKDSISKMECQNEETVLIADGAYSGKENVDLASEKNVKLVTTDLTGKEAPDIAADFEFNDEGKAVRCPMGHEPTNCWLNKKNGQCVLSFPRECCAECPYKEKCKANVHKKVSKVTTSRKSHDRAATRRYMTTDEFKNYARLRNGIETIPSNLRRNFHLEKLPRGKQRGKFFFGTKIMALNFRKLLNFRQGRSYYAQNTVLA